jgi:hypothetical protein
MEEKKNTKKKETPKKKVVKKEVKVKEEKKEVIKSVLPKEEPFNIKFRRFITSYGFLYTAFAILFVIVIMLALMVFTHKEDDKGVRSNIVFSIVEKETQSYLDMDLETLVGKEYILKVTNYRGNRLNTKGAHYTIAVTNNTNVEIEVLKNNQGENLITDMNYSVIEGEELSKTEKEEVIYYFRVKNADKIKAGDKIRIEVAS